MSYDGKCLELAQHFLSDLSNIVPAERKAIEEQLAQEIQTCIEDFLYVEPYSFPLPK